MGKLCWCGQDAEVTHVHHGPNPLVAPTVPTCPGIIHGMPAWPQIGVADQSPRADITTNELALLRSQLYASQTETAAALVELQRMKVEREGLYGEESYRMLREQHELACSALAASQRRSEALEAALAKLRCRVTGNLCGTDTVLVGAPPNCNSCEVHRIAARLALREGQEGLEQKSDSPLVGLPEDGKAPTLITCSRCGTTKAVCDHGVCVNCRPPHSCRYRSDATQPHP